MKISSGYLSGSSWDGKSESQGTSPAVNRKLAPGLLKTGIYDYTSSLVKLQARRGKNTGTSESWLSC